MRYPKRAYTFSVDYFSTPESVDPLFAVCDTANNIAFPVKEVVPEKLYFCPGKRYTNVTACWHAIMKLSGGGVLK